jgi:hypothetical protein
VAEDSQAFLQSSASIPVKHWGTNVGYSLVIYGKRFCSFPKAVALVTHFDEIRADCRVEHPARIQPSTSFQQSASLILSKQRFT